jgi:hypothetical protein
VNSLEFHLDGIGNSNSRKRGCQRLQKATNRFRLGPVDEKQLYSCQLRFGNRERDAYVAWNLRSEMPAIVVFGRDDTDAIEQACAAFGYRVRDYIALNCSPGDLVRIARVPELDHYEAVGQAPERLLAREVAQLVAQTCPT